LAKTKNIGWCTRCLATGKYVEGEYYYGFYLCAEHRKEVYDPEELEEDLIGALKHIAKPSEEHKRKPRK
jgi:hypothetical protein